MQGGVIGGICLLAFLLSIGRTEELEGLKELEDGKDAVQNIREAKETVDLKELIESEFPDDLRNDISLAVTESNIQDDEERSGAMARSPFQSKATAVAGGVPGSSLNPFNSEPSPYISPVSGLSQAEAQAISDSGRSYSQGQNSYPYSPSYPSVSSPAPPQGETDSSFYQPAPIATPLSSPYNQGLNSARTQTQAYDGYYQPVVRPIPSPILNPYNQGLSSTQARAQTENGSFQPGGIHTFNSSPNNQGSSSVQADRELYKPIIKPTSVLSQPTSRFTQASNSLSDFSSYPYSPGLSSAQANSVPYQPIPIPDLNFSPYEQFMVPYKEPSSDQTQFENGVYQPIPIPDPNSLPHNPLLVPYKEPSPTVTQGKYASYQPIALQKQLEDFTSLHNRGSSVPAMSSYYPYSNAPSENDTYQTIPTTVPSSFFRALDTVRTKSQHETSASQSSSFTNDMKTSLNYPYNPLRSGNNNPADYDFDLNLLPESASNLQAYNPYLPSGPNPKLYPSGAEAAPAYADAKTGATGVVNPYSQGLSSYPIDYPSESPFRPEGFNLNEPQRPFNVFASGQTSPLVFEDAKSRLILPYEYVFPHKMPGGENVVQCTKENEFHHFWSRGLDCLVCICFNEYGILSPVCASCGGCDNPPPKLPEPFPRLPESLPVRPATPEPFVPVPEPYPSRPQPEPVPSEPIPEPYKPVPSPEPPSPLPESTLPPPPPEAMCNPLPTGQPFTNPLHPCQICICREYVDSGKTDVQIQCKENPQCIAPADITTLPPISDAAVPVPLPVCEKFPEHVLFPHPTETCKLCKCSKSLSDVGVPEQHITCYPHPDCIPKLEPVTEQPGVVPPPLPIPIEPQKLKPYPAPEPTPPVPLREPYVPMEPVPLPEIVTVEPLPWPPTTAPLPTTVPTPVLTPRPGPLPGPSPHESCRPYPPSRAFQHPWDECQLCMCTEAFAVGMITVEVNCYTKPSCCIEPPDELKPAIPGTHSAIGYSTPYLGPSSAVNGPDTQALSNGPQAGVIITSTLRPPIIYSSYSPRPVNIYEPGSSQGSSGDTLTLPQGYPSGLYNRLPTDDKYANLPSSYTYQPNYQTGYLSPQYSEYPPRLPSSINTIGSYKPSSYSFPATYQYGNEDPVGTYPGSPGHYQPYDPRYQGVSPPNTYSTIYPRHEMPPIYPPGQIRDGYGQLQTSALTGSNAHSFPQGYLGNTIRSKTGNDGTEDLDASRI